MRKGSIIVIFILLATLRCLAAEPYNVLWQRGDQFYQQKEYDSAAYYFEQIAAQKPWNAEVYYNLGNTYYRLNRMGPAILNYERALRINPEYKEAKDNLVLAKSRVSNRIQNNNVIFFVLWFHFLTEATKATMWTILSLIAFLSVLGFSLVRRLRKGLSSIPPQFTGILIITWAVLLTLAFAASNNKVNSERAVVMDNDTPLMNNQHQGKPQILVPEGTTVELKGENNGWTEVQLPDGRTGWIQTSSIVKI